MSEALYRRAFDLLLRHNIARSAERNHRTYDDAFVESARDEWLKTAQRSLDQDQALDNLYPPKESTDEEATTPETMPVPFLDGGHYTDPGCGGRGDVS